MSFEPVPRSIGAVVRPHWYLLGLGVALVAGGFVFASRTLVVHSRTFFVEAAIYVLLQVAGWVILIEWLRLSGYLQLTDSG